MAIENDEVKKSLEEIQTAFHEFKKQNDARLEALKKEKSGADFDEKLERINETLNKQSRVHQQWIAEQEAKDAKRAAEEAEWREARKAEERKFEARANRLALGLGGSTGEEVLKGRNLLETKAYEKYLRQGKEALSADEIKVLTIGNDSTGGFLAPPSYQAEIIKALVEVSPFRQIVTVKTIGTAEYQQPKRTQTAAATRVGEISTRSETQNPAWGLMKIGAPEFYAEARISMQNIEDSAFNLEAELASDFAEQFAVSEGSEIANGDGVGKILGFLQANAAGPGVPIAFSTSGSAATIADSDGGANGIIDLFYGVKSGYSANGRFVLSRNTLGAVRKLKDSDKGYIWQPGLTAGQPATILGAPYTECPDMPSQGANTFPIAFGDWKKAFYLIDRLDVSITRDPFTLAGVGQVKFNARKRTGGQVVLGEAIRLLKCST